MMQQKARLRQKHKSPIGPQQQRSAVFFIYAVFLYEEYNSFTRRKAEPAATCECVNRQGKRGHEKDNARANEGRGKGYLRQFLGFGVGGGGGSRETGVPPDRPRL